MKLFFDLEVTKIMAYNFSVIPIRWLLTVDSEMAFFPFHSLTEAVLVFF